mgnify:CR=1 FL=1
MITAHGILFTIAGYSLVLMMAGYIIDKVRN